MFLLPVRRKMIYHQEGKTLKKYGVNELRKMFLEFFESKEHLAMKSFSLVLHNDKSLLLINSGMALLKHILYRSRNSPKAQGNYLSEMYSYR